MSHWMKTTLSLLLLVLLVSVAGPGQSALGQTQADKGEIVKQTPASPDVMNSLTADERAWLKEHAVIRVVQDPGWPPVEFVNEQGEFVGMAGDYLKIIEQRLGVTFERVQGLSWQEAYARLKRHEIDMTTSVAVTPERNEFWAFTKPYMKIPIAIVTHMDVTYIGDMDELAGKKAAVVEGYAVNDWIPRDFPEIQLVRFKTAEDCLKALQREEVFAYIDNMLVVGYYMARLKMNNLKIAGETPYVNAQCMAVRKDWAPLAGILQKALDSISQNQRNEIYRKWLPIHYEHGFDYTLLWYASAIFALLLLGLMGWNWKLAREIRSRKKAEKALMDSEEKFRIVFESANVGKSITLPTGEINANQAFCDMLGYTPEEMIHKKWQDLTHPDEIEANQKLLALLLEDKKDSIRFNRKYIHKNNADVWADVSVAIHRNDDRSPLFFITTIIDITERKQAEDALHLANERLRCFVDANVVGVVIATAAGKVIEANDYYLRLIGYTRREFEEGRMDWRAITPPEWLPADDRAIAELRERGACTPYEKGYVRRDGTRVFVLLSDAMMPGPEEQIAAFVLDITERKQSEEALSEANRQWQNTFDATNSAIWVLDAEQRVLRSNKTAEKFFHQPYREFIGKHCWEIVHKTTQPIPECPILRTKQTLKRETMDLQIDNGWFEIIVDPMLDAAGHFAGAVHAVSDITDRKKAEEALRKSEANLQAAQASAHLGSWEMDIAGQTVSWSAEMFRIFGSDPASGTLPLEEFLNIVHPDDRERIGHNLQKNLAQQQPYSDEYRIVHSDGSTRWIAAQGKPILDKKGDMVQYVGTAQDITGQKHAMTEQARLLYILESSLNEIYTFDSTSLRFEYANRGSLRNLGYTLEAMRSMTPVDIKPDFTEDSFRQAVAPLLRHEQKKVVFNTVHRRADGSLYPIEVHLQLIEFEGQRVFLGVILDITDRKQAESQKEAALAEIKRLNEELEQRVARRTAELTAKTAELERINKVFVDRELRMRELKDRIAELEGKKDKDKND